MVAKNVADCSTVPDIIISKSHEATGKLVPTKSSSRYESEYQVFCQWRNEHGVKQVEENVMLAYCLDLSKKGSSSSLWADILLVNADADLSVLKRHGAWKNSERYV